LAFVDALSGRVIDPERDARQVVVQAISERRAIAERERARAGQRMESALERDARERRAAEAVLESGAMRNEREKRAGEAVTERKEGRGERGQRAKEAIDEAEKDRKAQEKAIDEDRKQRAEQFAYMAAERVQELNKQQLTIQAQLDQLDREIASRERIAGGATDAQLRHLVYQRQVAAEENQRAKEAVIDATEIQARAEAERVGRNLQILLRGRPPATETRRFDTWKANVIGSINSIDKNLLPHIEVDTEMLVDENGKELGEFPTRVTFSPVLSEQHRAKVRAGNRDFSKDYEMLRGQRQGDQATTAPGRRVPMFVPADQYNQYENAPAQGPGLPAADAPPGSGFAHPRIRFPAPGVSTAVGTPSGDGYFVPPSFTPATNTGVAPIRVPVGMPSGSSRTLVPTTSRWAQTDSPRTWIPTTSRWAQTEGPRRFYTPPPDFPEFQVEPQPIPITNPPPAMIMRPGDDLFTGRIYEQPQERGMPYLDMSRVSPNGSRGVWVTNEPPRMSKEYEEYLSRPRVPYVVERNPEEGAPDPAMLPYARVPQGPWQNRLPPTVRSLDRGNTMPLNIWGDQFSPPWRPTLEDYRTWAPTENPNSTVW